MTFLNKICPKCGNTGQVYFSFNDDDGTWECTCYKCSKDFTVPNSEIPPELQAQKHKYSIHVLQSSNVFQGSGRPKFNDRSE